VETAQGVKFTEVDTSDAAATAKLPENASPVAQAASSGGAPIRMIGGAVGATSGAAALVFFIRKRLRRRDGMTAVSTELLDEEVNFDVVNPLYNNDNEHANPLYEVTVNDDNRLMDDEDDEGFGLIMN